MQHLQKKPLKFASLSSKQSIFILRTRTTRDIIITQFKSFYFFMKRIFVNKQLFLFYYIIIENIQILWYISRLDYAIVGNDLLKIVFKVTYISCIL